MTKVCHGVSSCNLASLQRTEMIKPGIELLYVHVGSLAKSTSLCSGRLLCTRTPSLPISAADSTLNLLFSDLPVVC